jgi:hypothetical protein
MTPEKLVTIHDSLLKNRVRESWRAQSEDAEWDYSKGIEDAFAALLEAGAFK